MSSSFMYSRAVIKSFSLDRTEISAHFRLRRRWCRCCRCPSAWEIRWRIARLIVQLLGMTM